MLDKYTFGNSPCAENLVSILNEQNNMKVNKRVSAFLQENNKIIKELEKMQDEKIKKHLTRIYRVSLNDSYLHEVPEIAKTHAINLLVAKTRNLLTHK